MRNKYHKEVKKKKIKLEKKIIKHEQYHDYGNFNFPAL